MGRYIDGDPRAFERLHTVLSPRLRGFLINMVRDEGIVDDLVQLTFLKAHLAREGFQTRGGDPDAAVKGWYFTIARNIGLDHLRSVKRRERRHADPEVAAEPNSIEDLLVDRDRADEIAACVRSALAQLPERQREVLELHKLRGMSMAEVAERLDLREGTVRVRAHRGYKALARILGVGGSSLMMLGSPRGILGTHLLDPAGKLSWMWSLW
jgi:RNA polymerase sigma-70 factor, ECF subfamily